MRRINFFGQFTPTTLDPTRAQSLRALAGFGQTVSNAAFPIAAGLAREEGRKQGQEVVRDEQGKIVPPEDRGNFTFFDQGYNEAAMLAYRAAVKRDTKEELNELRNQYQDDPEGFKAAAEAYRDGVLEGMPARFSTVIGEDISNAITNTSTSVQNEHFKRQRQNNLAVIVDSALDLEDDILQFAREGNEEGMNHAIAERQALYSKGVQAGLINPVNAEREQEKLQEAISVNQAIGTVERIFEQDIPLTEKVTQAKAVADADFADLNPQQVDALVSTLDTAIADAVEEATTLSAEQERKNALETVELQMDAQFSRRPAADVFADAYKMFNDGRISEKEYKGIYTDVMQAKEEQVEQNQIDMRVSQRLSGDDSVLLSQKEVDDYYEKNVESAVDELDPQARVPLLANFVTLTGTMPGKLAQRISNNLRSQDVDKITEASDLIDRLDNVRGIDTGIKPNDRAFASIVTNMAGVMSPEQAVDYATQLTDPRNAQRIESREAEIKEEEFDDEYSEWVEDEFDDADPIAMATLTKEFRDTFELHFKAGMDESEAKSKTAQLLKRNWKFSPSSDRMMKYRPEDYYAVGGNANYIKKQLGRYVSQNFAFDQDVESTFLVSDEETSRLASKGVPDYLVVVEMDNGELMMLSAVDPSDGKTKFIRWSPDVEKQQKKQAKENVEQGMKLREDSRFIIPDLTKMGF